MRPIDADALLRRCERLATEWRKMNTIASAELVMNQFLDIVNDAPTIGINCVNCKHYSEREDDNGVHGECMTEDDYWAMAEKHQFSEETPTFDYISRADAMGAVQDHFNDDGFCGYDDGQKMMDRINALPSADRPQWSCTANFVADMLAKLKEMTDEEKIKLCMEVLGIEAEGGDNE